MRFAIVFVVSAPARPVVPREEFVLVRDVVDRDAAVRDAFTAAPDASVPRPDVATARVAVVRDAVRATLSPAAVLIKLSGITRDATAPSAPIAGNTNSAINKNSGIRIIIITLYYITKGMDKK